MLMPTPGGFPWKWLGRSFLNVSFGNNWRPVLSFLLMGVACGLRQWVFWAWSVPTGHGVPVNQVYWGHAHHGPHFPKSLACATHSACNTGRNGE